MWRSMSCSLEYGLCQIWTGCMAQLWTATNNDGESVIKRASEGLALYADLLFWFSIVWLKVQDILTMTLTNISLYYHI